ncbi:MAG: hypothetical protein P1V36_07970 [Planctomycetota bacterium]|nr:hypothetical protein [Planctomycetota bacterium]
MRSLLALLVAGLLLALGAPPAEAGGGPETTLVVVNEDSPTSWRIANTYARLRGIPATNICAIPAPPNLMVISVDQFRERIWKPIEAYIAKHGLEDEIDTIAYSADFPYGVDYRKDFELKPKESQRDKLNWPPVASLTGLTYLHRHVKAKDREYLALNANQYLRVDRDGEMMPGHGFRRIGDSNALPGRRPQARSDRTKPRTTPTARPHPTLTDEARPRERHSGAWIPLSRAGACSLPPRVQARACFGPAFAPQAAGGARDWNGLGRRAEPCGHARPDAARGPGATRGCRRGRLAGGAAPRARLMRGRAA